MKVAVCVRCKARMVARGKKYVGCPNPRCKNWFPVKLLNRKHRDGEVNAVWQLEVRFFGGKAYNSWERVSKLAEKARHHERAGVVHE